jgi:hypothetical protein
MLQPHFPCWRACIVVVVRFGIAALSGAADKAG